MTKFIFLVSILISACVLEAKTIEIGIASNFSIATASNTNPYGNYFRDGINLAIKHSRICLKNKGIEIALREFDYGKKQSDISSLVREAASTNVLAVIGYNLSTQALLAAPTHHEMRLPMIVTSATASRLSTIGAYVHLVPFSNSRMGKYMADVARLRFRSKTAALIVAEDCAYCTDLATAFEKEFVKFTGLQVVRIGVLEGSTDFSNLLQRKELNEADIFILPNYELASARIISALAKKGRYGPFIGGDGWGDSGVEFFQILKGIVHNSYAVTHWHPGVTNKKSDKFVKDFNNLYKKAPSDTAVLAYDGMSQLLNVICHEKTISRQSIEDSLNKMKHFSGISGDFYYHMANSAPDKSFILQHFSEGKIKVLERIDPREKQK